MIKNVLFYSFLSADIDLPMDIRNYFTGFIDFLEKFQSLTVYGAFSFLLSCISMKYYLRPVLQATNTLVAKISEITSCKESSHKLRKFFRELLTLVLLLEHRYLILSPVCMRQVWLSDLYLTQSIILSGQSNYSIKIWSLLI